MAWVSGRTIDTQSYIRSVGLRSTYGRTGRRTGLYVYM